MSTHDEDHVPTPADQGHGMAVWVLFLAGPTLWFTHFILVYVLAEVLCKPLAGVDGVTALPLVSVLTVVATIVFALAAAVGSALAYRRWRESRDAPADDERASAQGESLVFAGFLLGVLFTVAVVFTGAPAVVLRPC